MKSATSWLGLASSALLAASQVRAITIDLNSQDSIKSAMSTATYDMMTWYVGNQTGQTPGMLPYADPGGYRYYWWQAGAMMGTLIDYWYFTGDTTYNQEVIQAMEWQAGPLANFEPQNESAQLGNDDQAFWAFSALMAAEYNFPNPPANQPSWLALAQAVFNRQVARWDPSSCGGGIRWQILSLNVGWDYKNSPSNACLFQIGARLAKYTGNSTYSDWANKEFEWMEAVGLISPSYQVWDGCTPTQNCTSFNHLQWSYTYAILVYGSAAMWNITTDPTTKALWETRTTGFIKAMGQFFKNNVINEPTCQATNLCNSDQQSFPAYSGRFLAASTKVAPFTIPLLQTWLSSSASAAAAACSGGTTGTFCGLVWTGNNFDGKTGIGEQMSAIEFFGSQIMPNKPGPLSAVSGGTSKSNPSAGTGSPLTIPGYLSSKITIADRAGAGIITAIICFTLVGSAVWMLR